MLAAPDRTNAELLIFTFELWWTQSVPAAERIQELLEQGASADRNNERYRNDRVKNGPNALHKLKRMVDGL